MVSLQVKAPPRHMAYTLPELFKRELQILQEKQIIMLLEMNETSY